MRIWLQSSIAIGKDSRLNSYEQSIKRHVQEVARPDTIVDIHGIDVVLPRSDRYHLAGHIQSSWLIKNAQRAEEEGYDAYVQVATLDHATYEIREVLDIPAVFILETSIHLACLLAPKFSVVAHTESLLLRVIEKVKEYGLRERMTPGAHLDLGPKDFNMMYENPKPYIDALIEKGKQVVEQGANIILVSGAMINRFLLDQGVREINGAPLLDQYGTAVKFGELMVDLRNIGIVRSEKGLYTHPSKEELAGYVKYLGV